MTTTQGDIDGWKHVTVDGSVYIANAAAGFYWCTKEKMYDGISYNVRFGAIRRLPLAPKRGTVAAGIRAALA